MSNPHFPNSDARHNSHLQISDSILNWWDKSHADLPWRSSRDPYAIWVAEVMLQQTQITTVIPYYQRWMLRFPSIWELAMASLDDVLKSWEGLGYYSRARNLHAAARIILDKFDGRVPNQLSDLISLPGIGRYTAGAIASIAFDQPLPVLDGNIMRVFARLIDLDDDIRKTTTKNTMWELADRLVPEHRPGDYNQALMELGQRLCTVKSPQCSLCPLKDICLAKTRGTQDQRPFRSPRKKIPHYDVVAGVIWQNETRSPTASFLIAQRPLNGLLGGLWEFPGGKQEDGETLVDALHREICEELELDIAIGGQLTKVNHAYTHFRITLHAYNAHYKGGEPKHIGVIDHAWVTLADLDNYAFAAADRQIISALREAFPGLEGLDALKSE